MYNFLKALVALLQAFYRFKKRLQAIFSCTRVFKTAFTGDKTLFWKRFSIAESVFSASACEQKRMQAFLALSQKRL